MSSRASSHSVVAPRMPPPIDDRLGALHLHRLDRVVGAVALPALVRARDRVVVELEAVAGRVARAEAAAVERRRGPEREPLGEQLVHHLVAERQVRDRRGDLRVRVEADLALHERVPVHAQAVRLAEERLLLEAVEPARVVAALHDHVRRLRREHRAELAGREHGLVGGDLRVDLAAHPREPGDVLRRRRLLDPVEVVLLEPPDAVDRGREVPRLVRVDPQQRLGPDRLAHGRDARVVALAGPRPTLR